MNPPRLRTVLLLGTLVAMALPLAGLYALRLYESVLVRQTESELLAQAAFVAASMRLAMQPPDLAAAAPGVGTTALLLGRRDGLDLARDPVLPAPPLPARAAAPEARAAAAGRAIQPLLREAQAVTLSAMRATDAAGVIVATTGMDAGLGLAAWEEVQQVLAGAAVATGLHRRELPARDVPGGIGRAAGLRVFVAMPVLVEGAVAGAVVLSRTPPTLGQAAWGKRWPLAGMASLMLAVGAGLALAATRLVARPVAAVAAQARSAARGETGALAPLRRPGTREVAALSDAILRMAGQIDQRTSYIRAFAASVSHEFKTPLAAARAAAELLEDAEAPGERRRLAALVADSTQRLDQLVRRLLELARADMMRPAAPAPLAPSLRTLCDRAGATLTVQGDPAIALPEPAVQALFTALLDNARAHAGPGAAIAVAATAGAEGVAVTIADDGPGIPPAHAARIFEPFFTTARDQGGTGLGLPIARALARAAGGTLALSPSARGAAFRLHVPPLEPRDGQGDTGA